MILNIIWSDDDLISWWFDQLMIWSDDDFIRWLFDQMMIMRIYLKWWNCWSSQLQCGQAAKVAMPGNIIIIIVVVVLIIIVIIIIIIIVIIAIIVMIMTKGYFEIMPLGSWRNIPFLAPPELRLLFVIIILYHISSSFSSWVNISRFSL